MISGSATSPISATQGRTKARRQVPDPAARLQGRNPEGYIVARSPTFNNLLFWRFPRDAIRNQRWIAYARRCGSTRSAGRERPKDELCERLGRVDGHDPRQQLHFYEEINQINQEERSARWMTKTPGTGAIGTRGAALSRKRGSEILTDLRRCQRHARGHRFLKRVQGSLRLPRRAGTIRSWVRGSDYTLVRMRAFLFY